MAVWEGAAAGRRAPARPNVRAAVAWGTALREALRQARPTANRRTAVGVACSAYCHSRGSAVFDGCVW